MNIVCNQHVINVVGKNEEKDVEGKKWLIFKDVNKLYVER